MPASPSCRICGSSAPHRHFQAAEMMFGTREPFDYFECSACGCVQIARIPAALHSYYPDGYYSLAKPNPRRWGKLKAWVRALNVRVQLSPRAGSLTLPLTRLLPIEPAVAALRPLRLPRRARILDVGSGSGRVLNALFRAGFHQVVGIDPHLAGDQRPPDGPPVLKRSLADLEGQWDVIMFHHSLEHIEDQAGTLRATAQRLAPNGWCLIRIPVASSWAWRHYGSEWVQLDAPRHLYLHTDTSLRLLAGQAGLQVAKVVHDSDAFQFWGSEQYRQGIPLRDPRSLAERPEEPRFSRAELRSFRRRARALNRSGQGDQAVFYLRPDPATPNAG